MSIRETRREGIRNSLLSARRWQLVELCNQLADCAAQATSLESLATYREEWFEAASSAQEIACVLWAAYPGFRPRRLALPEVFEQRRRHLIRVANPMRNATGFCS